MSAWRYWLFLILPAAWGQTAIKVEPGTAMAGGSGSLNISIASTSSSASTALEWTLSYSATYISNMKLAAGAALTSAGKSLSCADGNGQVRCIVWGLNTKPIPNGVLATGTFEVSLHAPSSLALEITGLTAISRAATQVAATASGATLTIRPAAKISKLSCTPTAISTPGKTACTVTLASAAVEAVSVALGLGAQSAKVTMPSAVTVPAGGTGATLTVTAGTVAAKSTAIVVASLNGVSESFSLSLLP
jgi:hypothetical protein